MMEDCVASCIWDVKLRLMRIVEFCRFAFGIVLLLKSSEIYLMIEIVDDTLLLVVTCHNAMVRTSLFYLPSRIIIRSHHNCHICYCSDI